jgi:hypothetical protein
MVNIEIIGYIATVFILASLSVSNLKILRIVNSLGAIGWITYGVLAGASSIVVGNVIMLLINIYKYRKEQSPLNKVKRYNHIGKL